MHRKIYYCILRLGSSRSKEAALLLLRLRTFLEAHGRRISASLDRFIDLASFAPFRERFDDGLNIP